jgi:hypothetical protein
MENLEPGTFVELTLEDDVYRAPDGREVTFNKLVTVRLNGQEYTTKLSYTSVDITEDNQEGPRTYLRIPCIRIDGMRYMLDGIDSDDIENELEVSVDSLVFGK